ncbi:carbohydrate-binding module family 20 domain-containing protein [Allohahella sp. A8]|uniref:carbohydrate-binding module family 20 domain-containing protein n=1 Tax=Allohahella sp. A8 TaxID=3141461 RepID=UPI003A8020C1
MLTLPRLAASAALKPFQKSILAGALACASMWPVAASANVMVHLFEWRWADIARECETYLGPKGFTAVQVSPPQAHIPGPQWWTRYQPVSYRLESRSGNRAEFINMVQRCRAVGVDIVVDMVVNHMAAGRLDYPEVPYGPNDFHERNCPGINYRNADEVWNCDLVGLKDLKTESGYVRGKIIDYFNDLTNIGVKGFRVDAAKHIPPGDVAAIVNNINGNPYIFLEVIRAGGEAIQPEDYVSIADVTEFAMERDLAYNFRNGTIANLIDFNRWSGRVDSSQALTFVANHDDQRQHPEYTLSYKDPQGMYYLANTFMLAYPYGYARLMSSYYFNDENQGPPVSGVHSGNSCFDGGWVCEHRWGGTGNMVKFREVTSPNWYTSNVTTDGPNRLAFGRGGLGYVALNNRTDTWSTVVQTGMPSGEYCDVMHGDFANGACTGPTIVVDGGGYAAITVTGRDAIAIHQQSLLGGRTDPQPEPGMKSVELSCDNGQTVFGQSVYAVGGSDELGNWSPAAAVKLDPVAYPRWAGTVALPAQTAVEWKCLKRSETNPAQQVQWQGGSNNLVEAAATSSQGRF